MSDGRTARKPVSYKIALNFEDGVTRFVSCAPGQKLSDAAYRVGINVPLDCREGACGTCKATCESGSFDMDDYVEDALSAEEAASGLVLTCRMSPTSDCIVGIPAPSTACLKGPIEYHMAEIRSVDRLSRSTFRLRIGGASLRGLDFLPGQYANLSVPGTDAARAYSFSSLVLDDTVEFLIRHVPGGVMSTYLDQHAKAGGEIRLRGPLGSFFLRDARRPILMLAGGTGLAPFLPMLEHFRISGSGEAPPVKLAYGVTRDEDLVLVDELETYTAMLPNFSWLSCVADTGSAHSRIGFVTDFLDGADFRNGDVDIYVCGPPPMVEAVNKMLSLKGLVPAGFHYEKFVASR
jgi:benzoate/toluate 1,2-dioxygenase reductase subunit